MAENKTAPTDADVQAFLTAVEHPVRRDDGFTLLELMTRCTGHEAVMWGPSIVGFDSYHYKYDSGHEGDAAAVGFSPRKASLSLYGLTSAPEAPELLAKLGKHKTGVGCLYITRLEQVDLGVLEQLVETGYRFWTTGAFK